MTPKGEYTNPVRYHGDSPFTPIETRKDRVDITHCRCPGWIAYDRPHSTYDLRSRARSCSGNLLSAPKLIRKSRETKAGVYIGKGLNRWSNVHIQDFTALYAFALEKALSGVMLFAENGEESFFTLAQAISQELGFHGKTQSWSISDAMEELGDWARLLLGSNSRIQALHARNLLGWKPSGESTLKATWPLNRLMRQSPSVVCCFLFGYRTQRISSTHE